MISLVVIIIVLTVVQAIHLVEEIKAGFRKKFPLGPVPRWLMIAGNVILYLYAAATGYLVYTGKGAGLTMAWIFALLMLGNALGHLAIMLIRKKYFPGGYTAPLLFLISIYLIVRLAQF